MATTPNAAWGAGLPPGIGNPQQAMQATAALRQSPWYQQWLQKNGLVDPPPGVNGGNPITPDGRPAQLTSAQQSDLMSTAQKNGVGISGGSYHIDQNGQIAHNESHILRNVLLGVGMGGLALTGFGAAGMGPLAGMFGAGAGAADAGGLAAAEGGLASGAGAGALDASMFPGFVSAADIAGGAGAAAGAAGAAGAGGALADALPGAELAGGGSGAAGAAGGAAGAAGKSGMGFMDFLNSPGGGALINAGGGLLKSLGDNQNNEANRELQADALGVNTLQNQSAQDKSAASTVAQLNPLGQDQKFVQQQALKKAILGGMRPIQYSNATTTGSSPVPQGGFDPNMLEGLYGDKATLESLGQNQRNLTGIDPNHSQDDFTQYGFSGPDTANQMGADNAYKQTAQAAQTANRNSQAGFINGATSGNRPSPLQTAIYGYGGAATGGY